MPLGLPKERINDYLLNDADYVFMRERLRKVDPTNEAVAFDDPEKMYENRVEPYNDRHQNAQITPNAFCTAIKRDMFIALAVMTMLDNVNKTIAKTNKPIPNNYGGTIIGASGGMLTVAEPTMFNVTVQYRVKDADGGKALMFLDVWTEDEGRFDDVRHGYADTIVKIGRDFTEPPHGECRIGDLTKGMLIEEMAQAPLWK